MKDIKCVLVGDSSTGKTCIAISLTTNTFPGEYIPSTADNYAFEMRYKAQEVRLNIVDTYGSDEYDNLRPMSYNDTDVFIICFSILSRQHFDRVKSHWISEVKPYAKNASIILVGSKLDTRGTLPEHVTEEEISHSEGESMAREIGAKSYMECSAKTQENLKEVFDEVCRVHLGDSTPIKGKKDTIKKPRFRRFRN